MSTIDYLRDQVRRNTLLAKWCTALSYIIPTLLTAVSVVFTVEVVTVLSPATAIGPALLLLIVVVGSFVLFHDEAVKAKWTAESYQQSLDAALTPKRRRSLNLVERLRRRQKSKRRRSKRDSRGGDSFVATLFTGFDASTSSSSHHGHTSHDSGSSSHSSFDHSSHSSFDSGASFSDGGSSV